MGRNAVETVLGAVVLMVAGVFAFFAYTAAEVRAVSGYQVKAAFYKIGGLAKGADVLIVFVESYGRVSFDKPEFAFALAERRRQLAAAIHDTHRDVVSAYVTSPTFGGSSWLAHVSLLSGIEVRDPDTNFLLMTQKRDTLVTHFARHGYRTVGLMPGMWQTWPEGVFYGFDDIYGGKRLDYRGPQFGWWDIPDQFAIARFTNALNTEPFGIVHIASHGQFEGDPKKSNEKILEAIQMAWHEAYQDAKSG